MGIEATAFAQFHLALLLLFYRVRIRNMIGGAAGAHISMTSYTFTHVWFPSRKTPVFVIVNKWMGSSESNSV